MNCSIHVSFVFLLLIPVTGFSQLQQKRFELGISAGVAVYQGDLTPNRLGSFETMRPAIVIHAGKLISSSFTLSGALLLAGLRGDETVYDNPEYRKQRAFKFRTPVAELSATIYYNPFGSNYDSKGFSPFVFAGAGFSVLNIKRDYSAFNAAYFGDGSDIPARIAADNQQQPPGFIPIIPLGAGIRYNFSEQWALQAASSYRLMFTDYLDGFSQSVNPERNDHYHTTTVGLIYRTGGGSKNKNGCPAVKY